MKYSEPAAIRLPDDSESGNTQKIKYKSHKLMASMLDLFNLVSLRFKFHTNILFCSGVRGFSLQGIVAKFRF